jgi:hypothetical protein
MLLTNIYGFLYGVAIGFTIRTIYEEYISPDDTPEDDTMTDDTPEDDTMTNDTPEDDTMTDDTPEDDTSGVTELIVDITTDHTSEHY